MKYFFVLGNNKTLSVAEIVSVFGEAASGHLLGGGVFVFETEEHINSREVIKKIGGTVKIGNIRREVHELKQVNILKEVEKIVDSRDVEGKFKYGISNYGKAKINTKQLAMELKKHLQEKGVSSRWVTSKKSNLSSVVVGQNGLTEKGIEIVLLKYKNKILIGETLAVQPFKELSRRDYGRPARDDASGMLPPKLAQIMLNLSKTTSEDIVLDPFCGSGTLITEAMLMGYKNLIGTDISKKAISDTGKNLEWVIKNTSCVAGDVQLKCVSATDLSKHIKPGTVDAVVTEPFLGPQKSLSNILSIRKDLEKLYSSALREFKKILSENGGIVMLWPVFKISGGDQLISPNISGFKIINPIPKEFLSKQGIEVTKRNTIIYGREGQRVWREVVVLVRE